MNIKNIGIEIARRDLVMNSGQAVTVRLGKPEKFPSGNDDYYCPFAITGLGNDAIQYAGGVDSIQAMWLALQKIGTILYTSQQDGGGPLTWNGERNLGFPVPDSIRDLPPRDGKQS